MGEFGDRDDVRVTALVLIIVVIFLGVVLLFSAFSDQIASAYLTSAMILLGALLVIIGIVLLFLTMRWIRGKK